VQTIAVLEKHQGTGIGSAMLTELLGEAHRRGAREIFLEVRADNPRAQAVYRHFGFEDIGTRRRYYDDGTDAIMMRRKLGD
jgi:ribosomal-protein-alanine N-acetyltransferase